MKHSVIIFFAVFTVSCDFEPREAPRIAGMEYSRSTEDPRSTLDQLQKAVEANPKLKVIKRIDHPELDLGLIFFGNPKIGSPLMMDNQMIGIDLPQRMLAYPDGGSGSYLVYNSGGFQGTSFGLRGHQTFEKIEDALVKLNAAATGTEPERIRSMHFSDHKGVRKWDSKADFRSTYEMILEGASEQGYNVLLELDHGENARKNGIELRNTRLILIEDPELNPLLAKTDKTLFLDVWPMKFLAWEDEKGRSHVAFHRLEFHFERRKINLNSRAFLQTKRMQSYILERVKKNRIDLPKKDLPS